MHSENRGNITQSMENILKVTGNSNKKNNLVYEITFVTKQQLEKGFKGVKTIKAAGGGLK